MRRQLIGVALIGILLAGGSLQAQAAEQTGTIRVVMEQAAAADAVVGLHYVGKPMADGYRLPESFGGGIIRREDAGSSDLAQWLADTVTEEGEKQNLQKDGTAEFMGLQEGLYLLIQNETAQGYLAAAPFLVPMPCNGMWEVSAFPKMQKILTESPQTGQHPAPIIGAMGIVLSGMGLAICWEKLRKK